MNFKNWWKKFKKHHEYIHYNIFYIELMDTKEIVHIPNSMMGKRYIDFNAKEQEIYNRVKNKSFIKTEHPCLLLKYQY